MSLFDEALPFVLGAIMPNFLQTEGQRRQGLSPTQDYGQQPPQQEPAPRQPQPQQSSIDPGFYAQPVQDPMVQGRSDPGFTAQPKQWGQDPGFYAKPNLPVQFAPYPTSDQQGQPASTQGDFGNTGPAAHMGMQYPTSPNDVPGFAGGWYPTQTDGSTQPAAQPAASPVTQAPQSRGLLGQLGSILSSPLGQAGVQALATGLITPKWVGIPAGIGNVLMGGLSGYEHGQAAQSQAANIQMQADYHRQQAEYQRQQALLQNQKMQMEQMQVNNYNAAMQRLRQTDPDLADRVAVGITKQPDMFDTFLRAHNGDIHATINDPDFHKAMTMGTSGRAYSVTQSWMDEAVAKGLQPGSKDFNDFLADRAAQAAGVKPAEKRAESKVETDKVVNYARDLNAYMRSDEYRLAYTDDPKKAEKLLEKKKAELGKRHGLKADPDTGEPFGETKPKKASLEELFPPIE